MATYLVVPAEARARRQPTVPPGKRWFDVILSAVGLLASAPLWGLIALIIKLDDGGPIFYAQERVGKHGRHFRSLKFRSMAPDSDRLFGPRQASEADARITAAGRWLRATAMDELPQLWNILRGDMSFVGPRALMPEEVEVGGFGQVVPLEKIPGYHERHRVTPGLTGVAQIYADRDIPRRHKFKYDLLYVRRQRFGLDVRLILLSFWITFRGKWEVRGPKFSSGGGRPGAVAKRGGPVSAKLARFSSGALFVAALVAVFTTPLAPADLPEPIEGPLLSVLRVPVDLLAPRLISRARVAPPPRMVGGSVALAPATNAIRSVSAVDLGEDELRVTVDYAYGGDFGHRDIFLHAVALQTDDWKSRVPGTSFPEASVQVGDGTVEITIKKVLGAAATTSTRIKVCMVSIQHRSAFLCETFPFTKAWGVPGPAPSGPTEDPAGFSS
jgi:lipopolysaccharide/colanic/teichoic acid biosynthesis glycosyltransferase